MLAAAVRGDERWWPGVTVPQPVRAVDTGERLTLAVRSPVGYRLRVALVVTAVTPGRMLTADATGDLRGTGRVEIVPDGADAASVLFRWEVETERAWMNATAWLLRPVFTAAHVYVMARGERGLRRALVGG